MKAQSWSEHPWAEFLRARQRAIRWLLEEGRTPDEITKTMSMDPVQVSLIAIENREFTRCTPAHTMTGCLQLGRCVCP